jgi:hypothetical protein
MTHSLTVSLEVTAVRVKLPDAACALGLWQVKCVSLTCCIPSGIGNKKGSCSHASRHHAVVDIEAFHFVAICVRHIAFSFISLLVCLHSNAAVWDLPIGASLDRLYLFTHWGASFPGLLS